MDDEKQTSVVSNEVCDEAGDICKETSRLFCEISGTCVKWNLPVVGKNSCHFYFNYRHVSLYVAALFCIL
jgi:hypothetical protein